MGCDRSRRGEPHSLCQKDIVMESLSQCDYQAYVEDCKASSNIILSECEYQAANVSYRGFLDKEVANVLRKSVNTISFQLKKAKIRLGIDKNVELTWYMQCVALRKNFDLTEIRKHGVAVFFSIWFLILAMNPSIQFDMRKCLRQNNGNTIVRVMPRRNNNDFGNYNLCA